MSSLSPVALRERLTRPRAEPVSGWLGVLAWMLSRSVMAYLFATLSTFIRSDVNYYFRSIDDTAMTHSGDLSTSLVEYPVPVVWIMQALRLLSGPSEDVYVFLFALCLAGLDAWCCWLLWARVSRLSAGLWMLFIFLIGPLIWFRIDLIPAVFVLIALKEMDHRPRLAGAAIALGAATKLWPALLVVPMLGLHRNGRRRGLGFLVTGLLVGLGSLLTQGLTRSASPLAWQSARGLQIESVWASWLMVARLGPNGSAWTVRLSEYNAYEIFGPGTSSWQHAGTIAMVLLIAFVGVLGWLVALGGAGLPRHSLRLAGSDERRRDRAVATMLATLAVICGVIVANKTFSPQYMIWLAGPFALLIAAQLRSEDRRHALVMACLGLLAAALTQIEFPLGYSALVRTTHPGVAMTVVLVVRNILVMVLTGYAGVLAVVASWRVGHVRSRHTAASDPTGRSGTDELVEAAV